MTETLNVAVGTAAGQKVQWDPDRWRPSDGPLAPHRKIVDRLAREDSDHISRRQLHERADGDATELFIASMIWGFGIRGYGPARLQKMLLPPRSGEALSEELDLIRQTARTSASDGFIALYHQAGPHQGKTRIHQLGTAFGTKYLHFAASGHMKQPGAAEPLIYDALVSRALPRFWDVPIPTASSYLKGTEYQAYCDWAAAQAAGDATAADVECELFKLGGG